MTVTACLTMGRRPALLAQTLQSLGDVLATIPVLAVNDFGDAETNEVFHRLCPHGRIVDPGGHLGHHAAVDRLYAEVTTPHVFHFEDDWHFTRRDFLPDALRVLEANPALVSVCLRQVADFGFGPDDLARITQHDGYYRFDALHDQWYGYTFNPHLARIADWRALGGFSAFRKERHISRHLRAQGRAVGFLKPGACHHIGENDSVSTPPPGAFKRFKRWLRGERPPAG